MRSRTYRIVTSALATMLLIVVALAVTSFVTLRVVHDASARVRSAAEDRVAVARLRAVFEHSVAAHRGYLLAGAEEFRGRAEEARRQFREMLGVLQAAADAEAERELLECINVAEARHYGAMARAVAVRGSGRGLGEIEAMFEAEVAPRRAEVREMLDSLAAERGRTSAEESRRATDAVMRSRATMVAIAALALVAGVLVAAAQLRSARREQRAMERWVEFLSVASHDVKSPLAALRLQVEVLERLLQPADAFPDRVHEVVGKIGRQVSRMTALVGNVLDVSRLQLGSLRLDLHPVDLAEVARDVAERMRPQFEARETPLSVQTARPVTGEWDRLRLEQVVANLLSNALKYGEQRPVEMAVEAEGETARLTVRDHGLGIPAEEQGSVFERFARVSGDRRPGHGLGLWITRTIVESHGGRVRLTSAPGVGSTFGVELPLGTDRGNGTRG